MTDAELIAALLEDTCLCPAHVAAAAADRIEALVRERDAPKHLTDALDAALKGYTPGIDRAVRFVSIDQVDMLAEFYLNQRKGRG
jgi:hypothetical protein